MSRLACCSSRDDQKSPHSRIAASSCLLVCIRSSSCMPPVILLSRWTRNSEPMPRKPWGMCGLRHRFSWRYAYPELIWHVGCPKGRVERTDAPNYVFSDFECRQGIGFSGIGISVPQLSPKPKPQIMKPLRHWPCQSQSRELRSRNHEHLGISSLANLFS